MEDWSFAAEKRYSCLWASNNPLRSETRFQKLRVQKKKE